MKLLFAILALLVASKAPVQSSVIIIANPGGGNGPGYLGNTVPGSELEQQFVLELINRARANPLAEAARQGIHLNDGLEPGTISEAARPPLARSLPAEKAAFSRAVWMLPSLIPTPGTVLLPLEERLSAAGYVFTAPSGCSECVESQPSYGTIATKDLPERLFQRWFLNPETRTLLLDPAFDESGVGLVFQRSGSGSSHFDLYGAAVCAYSAGSPTPAGPYVLGVAYQDKNSNGFYDVGEGLPNVDVQVTPGGFATKTSASGGYTIPRGTTSGNLIATFSGTGVPVPTQIPFSAMPGQNVKVDLVLPAVSSVGATRIIGVSGNFDFGELVVGNSRSRTLTIANSGNSPLTVSGIIHSCAFITGSFSGTIPVGASQEVSVIFHPGEAGFFSGTLTVNSNATSGHAALAEKGRAVLDAVVATPKITPGGSTFAKKAKVKISCATPKATIYYTLDGSEPTEISQKYKGPFQLKEATTVKAKAYSGYYQSSGVATATYTKN